jgi:hypothetical protein
METSKAVFASVTFALALVAPAQGADTHAEHIFVAPKDLKWVDVPSLPKGAKAAVIEGPMNEAKPFMFRIKFPANYKVPPHWHTSIEHVTVLSGTLHFGIGDKLDQTKTTALAAGHVSIMQPKTNHFVWTKVETIAQVHGMGPWEVNYVNPEDDPRKKSK